MNRHLMLGALLAALAGCNGTNHSIEASEFQRSCAVDSDCVPVYEGTLSCCGGGCPNAAVNQVGYQAYQSVVSSRIPTCSPAPPCVLLKPICMAGAICSNGTCTFEEITTDASLPD